MKGINWWTLTFNKLARSVHLKLYDVYFTVEPDAVQQYMDVANNSNPTS